jgi:hypothetical protein
VPSTATGSSEASALRNCSVRSSRSSAPWRHTHVHSVPNHSAKRDSMYSNDESGASSSRGARMTSRILSTSGNSMWRAATRAAKSYNPRSQYAWTLRSDDVVPELRNTRRSSTSGCAAIRRKRKTSVGRAGGHAPCRCNRPYSEIRVACHSARSSIN